MLSQDRVIRRKHRDVNGITQTSTIVTSMIEQICFIHLQHPHDGSSSDDSMWHSMATCAASVLRWRQEVLLFEDQTSPCMYEIDRKKCKLLLANLVVAVVVCCCCCCRSCFSPALPFSAVARSGTPAGGTAYGEIFHSRKKCVCSFVLCFFVCLLVGLLFVCAKIHALYPHHCALHDTVKHTHCLAQLTVKKAD